MNNEPQLPEFVDDGLIIVNTEHHKIEIEKSEIISKKEITIKYTIFTGSKSFKFNINTSP